MNATKWYIRGVQLFLILALIGCGSASEVTIQYSEKAEIQKQNMLDVLRKIENGETEQTDFRVRMQQPHTNDQYRTLSIIRKAEHYRILILDANGQDLLNTYKLDRAYVQKDTLPSKIIHQIIPAPK